MEGQRGHQEFAGTTCAGGNGPIFVCCNPSIPVHPYLYLPLPLPLPPPPPHARTFLSLPVTLPPPPQSLCPHR